MHQFHCCLTEQRELRSVIEIRLDYHNDVYYYAHSSSGHMSFIYFIVFVGFSWQCNRTPMKSCDKYSGVRLRVACERYR